jgi:hypothetical protein
MNKDECMIDHRDLRNMATKPVVKTTVYIKNGAKAHDRRRHNDDVSHFANTIPQTCDVQKSRRARRDEMLVAKSCRHTKKSRRDEMLVADGMSIFAKNTSSSSVETQCIASLRRTAGVVQNYNNHSSDNSVTNHSQFLIFN